MQKGCTQLYYGDGKGKTTAAMGQIVRCVGHGFKVLVYQFLKEPNSGEVSIIRSLPGVDYIENEGPIPFMFNLTPEQQEFYKEKFQKKFDEVREKYFTGNYDLVVLDEVIDAYNLGTIQKEQLLEMMRLHRECFRKRLFVFVNLKSFFSENEITLFYQSVFYEKLSVLLLESGQKEPVRPCEEVRIIDKDLCEF